MVAALPKPELHAVLWNDLAEVATFPENRPLLAHYTSVETFAKIVETDEIWFSNPLYMNDWQELVFGMEQGASDFRSNRSLVDACESEERHRTLVKFFDELFREFDVKHALDTYVFCFSEHESADDDGSLAMWRGYGAGGRGVALVFDTEKLGPIGSSPLVLGKVVYGNEPARLDWIDKKIHAIAEVLARYPKTDANLRLVANEWIERLKMFSLFTKHSGFAEEKEWRVVYLSQRDESKSLESMLGYAVTPRGVEPKLKLKLGPIPGVMDDSVSIESLADRVILGPSISTVLAGNSIRRMLERVAKPSLAGKICASSIPFRP